MNHVIIFIVLFNKILLLSITSKRIIENVSTGKSIPINQLTYWNVELQEAYFSPKEALKSRRR